MSQLHRATSRDGSPIRKRQKTPPYNRTAIQLSRHHEAFMKLEKLSLRPRHTYNALTNFLRESPKTSIVTFKDGMYISSSSLKKSFQPNAGGVARVVYLDSSSTLRRVVAVGVLRSISILQIFCNIKKTPLNSGYGDVARSYVAMLFLLYDNKIAAML
ncbi:hypothetical protein CEXT_745641 [Caerostris extrusa]|uniref:Uncharacterized protein n=1 Tax=Caerostris extrusa TaxID=172846 RepID=A0AAV4RGG0_CAEEX|nr:hypothetical protein CEXT_745641 [Caerostris extrusa]